MGLIGIHLSHGWQKGRCQRLHTVSETIPTLLLSYKKPEVYILILTKTIDMYNHSIFFMLIFPLCLGAQHARLTARIALEELIERFKDVQCVPDVPLRLVDSFFTYGLEQLPLRLQKR